MNMTKFSATIRFYEELNDFLQNKKKKQVLDYCFEGNPSVKDVIESFGVPHVEVDLILVNSRSVDFNYQVKANDFISVYPVFEALDITKVTLLRTKPLREPRFILDVHLGKLCRYLRLLGFDTLYRNNYDDPEIIEIAGQQNRIILTRDLGILKVKTFTHGYWLRSDNPRIQLDEVIGRFNLYNLIKPFNRCIKCNGAISAVNKEDILDQLKPLTKQFFNHFYQCNDCGNIFWEGSHFDKMENFVESVLKAKEKI
jgi:uncharacterized protein